MDEAAVRDRIQVFMAKRERKIASFHVNSNLRLIEFDASIAPLIEKPVPVFYPVEPSDPWDSDETTSKSPETQEFNFALTLESHPLAKEPESLKHLTNHLILSQVPNDEPLEFSTISTIPAKLANCPTAGALSKMALDSKTCLFIGEAKSAMDSNDWLKAFQLLNKAIDVDQKCSVAYYGLALACLREHLLDKAIENLTHALELESGRSDRCIPIRNNLYAALVARAHELTSSSTSVGKAMSLLVQAAKIYPGREEATVLLTKLQSNPISGLQLAASDAIMKHKFHPIDPELHYADPVIRAIDQAESRQLIPRHHSSVASSPGESGSFIKSKANNQFRASKKSSPPDRKPYHASRGGHRTNSQVPRKCSSFGQK